MLSAYGGQYGNNCVRETSESAYKSARMLYDTTRNLIKKADFVMKFEVFTDIFHMAVKRTKEAMCMYITLRHLSLTIVVTEKQ